MSTITYPPAPSQQEVNQQQPPGPTFPPHHQGPPQQSQYLPPQHAYQHPYPPPYPYQHPQHPYYAPQPQYGPPPGYMLPPSYPPMPPQSQQPYPPPPSQTPTANQPGARKAPIMIDMDNNTIMAGPAKPADKPTDKPSDKPSTDKHVRFEHEHKRKCKVMTDEEKIKLLQTMIGCKQIFLNPIMRPSSFYANDVKTEMKRVHGFCPKNVSRTLFGCKDGHKVLLGLLGRRKAEVAAQTPNPERERSTLEKLMDEWLAIVDEKEKTERPSETWIVETAATRQDETGHRTDRAPGPTRKRRRRNAPTANEEEDDTSASASDSAPSPSKRRSSSSSNSSSKKRSKKHETETATNQALITQLTRINAREASFLEIEKQRLELERERVRANATAAPIVETRLDALESRVDRLEGVVIHLRNAVDTAAERVVELREQSERVEMLVRRLAVERGIDLGDGGGR